MTDRLRLLSPLSVVLPCILFVSMFSGSLAVSEGAPGALPPNHPAKRLPCTTCDSHGTLECDFCFGVGKTRHPCPRCVSARNGKSLGKIDCGSCEKGLRKCRTCNGKGFKLVERLAVAGGNAVKRVACKTCQSTGDRTCKSCRAGLRKCPKCKTAGFLETRCALCKGKKSFECYTCRGVGSVEALPISPELVEQLGTLKAQACGLESRVEIGKEKYEGIVERTTDLREETVAVGKYLGSVQGSIHSTDGWPDDLRTRKSRLLTTWKAHGRLHKRHLKALAKFARTLDKKLEKFQGLKNIAAWVDTVFRDYHGETEDELRDLMRDRLKRVEDYEQDVPRWNSQVAALGSDRETLRQGLVTARKNGQRLTFEIERHRDRVIAEKLEKRRTAENYALFEKHATSLVADLPLPKGVKFKLDHHETRSADSLVVEARYTARSRPETTGPALEVFVARAFEENDALDTLRLTLRSTLVQPELRGDRDMVTLNLTRSDVAVSGEDRVGGRVGDDAGAYFVRPPPPREPSPETSTARIFLLYVAPVAAVLVATIVFSLVVRSRRSYGRDPEFN